MKKEEILQVLDKVFKNFKGTRDEHIYLNKILLAVQANYKLPEDAPQVVVEEVKE